LDAVSLPLHRGCRELLRPDQRVPVFGNVWLQTTLIEAAKLAPRWNPQLAAVHERELQRGHRNRATLQVERKLVAYLMAVDKSGKPFQLRSSSAVEAALPPKKKGKARRPAEVLQPA
jgi:hypothetical protein